jgi:hypothetical protein
MQHLFFPFRNFPLLLPGFLCIAVGAHQILFHLFVIDKTQALIIFTGLIAALLIDKEWHSSSNDKILDSIQETLEQVTHGDFNQRI